MSFDPTKPVEHTEIDAVELRNQFNGLKTEIDQKLPATEKGVANGVASLDANGRLAEQADWNNVANKPGLVLATEKGAANGVASLDANGVLAQAAQWASLSGKPTPAADGTYIMGFGTATNGTITVVNGIITAVQQATNAPPMTFDGISDYLPDGSLRLHFSHTGDTGAADEVVWGSHIVGGSGSNAQEVGIGASIVNWMLTMYDVGNDIAFGYQLMANQSLYGPAVVVGSYSWDGSNPPTFTT